MASRDPEVRSAISRMGAVAQRAKHDPLVTTAAARAKAFERFINEVDPDRKLPEAERMKRARAAQRLHMMRLNIKSVKARKARKAAIGAQSSDEAEK
jgi:hypothetical protein